MEMKGVCVFQKSMMEILVEKKKCTDLAHLEIPLENEDCVLRNWMAPKLKVFAFMAPHINGAGACEFGVCGIYASAMRFFIYFKED